MIGQLPQKEDNLNLNDEQIIAQKIYEL